MKATNGNSRKDRRRCAHCGEYQARYLRRFCVSCDLRVCVDCTAESFGSIGSPDRPHSYLAVMEVVCLTCAPTPDENVRIERSGAWWVTRVGRSRARDEEDIQKRWVARDKRLRAGLKILAKRYSVNAAGILPTETTWDRITR